MSKPRISVREGIGGKRLWACVSTVTVWVDGRPVPLPERLGYGVSPAEAYAEWEAS